MVSGPVRRCGRKSAVPETGRRTAAGGNARSPLEGCPPNVVRGSGTTARPVLWGTPMNFAEQRSFVQSLVTKPYDQYTLLAVYEALGKDPSAYADLLVTAAESTDQHTAASHWLTEAA